MTDLKLSPRLRPAGGRKLQPAEQRHPPSGRRAAVSSCPHTQQLLDEPIEELLDELPIQADDGDAPSTDRETVMQFMAVRFARAGMRHKDIRNVCGVSDYFLGNMARDPAGKRKRARDRRVRRGRREPGIWSLCRTKELRLEAAMFIVDWVVADQPFTSRPNPIALDRIYCRYRHCWQDKERRLLGISACLAIIRHIRSGKLLLNRCLMCKRLSIEAPVQADGSGCGDTDCSFCGSPHKIPCQLTPDQRVLEPA